jgi:serine/threonine-protein kinase
LANAHAAGLVHGSITTERITKTARGAVLRDFGLFDALTCGGLESRDVAILLSDPAFVSPEVRMGAVPDERSVVFSLGAALYELLTGKPPYGGRTTSFVMAAVLSDSAEYRELDGVSTAEPAPGDRAEPVVEALIRAIEQAPEDRWPSAGAFAVALAAGITSTRTTAEREAKKRGWLERLRGFFP